MTLDVTHFGLYFEQSDVENTKSQRDKEPELQTAWQWLLASPGDVIQERKPDSKDGEPEQVIKPQLAIGGQLVNKALRYRFAGDKESGKSAAQMLVQGYGLQDGETLFETVTNALSAAQVHELLRDALPDGDVWRGNFAQFTESLLNVEDVETVEQLWLLALKMVSAVVLEDNSLFESAVADYKQVIDTIVHPEGFFRPLSKAAEDQDKETAFREMVLACAALTLTAEAATLAGENLWEYENRDVGLNTAVTYLVYYYFYPAKWRWGTDDLSNEQTEAIFAEYGAWIEISTRRVNPRGVELLLEEQRPFFNPYMGGLTTLSHFKMAKRKRFGLFG